MSSYKGQDIIASLTPEQILEAFTAGKDTATIAKELMVPEASVYKLLAVAKDVQGLFDDNTGDPDPAPVNQSPMARGKKR
jgi:hypothetical protein